MSVSTVGVSGVGVGGVGSFTEAPMSACVMNALKESHAWLMRLSREYSNSEYEQALRATMRRNRVILRAKRRPR